MRRTDRKITDYKKIVTIMQNCDCCRLGLLDGKIPYIVPLNFGIQEQEGKLTLYFHSAKTGKKIELMKQNPRACFEMDTSHILIRADSACGYGMKYQSVIGNGTVYFVEDEGEKLQGLKAIMANYTDDAALPFEETMMKKVAVIKLKIEKMSGKEYI